MDAARLEREKDFHNERYATEGPRRESGFYAAVMESFARYGELAQAKAAGGDVLELGCGPGAALFAHNLQFRRYVAIDISDVAIAQTEALAKQRGITGAEFQVANAEDTGLPAQSFDLILGTGIIHHLSIEPVYKEINRLLRPGGTALFLEPLGHNPIINLYRAVTPGARTPDEHPLKRADFDLAREMFATVDIEAFGLFTLGALAFKKTPLYAGVHRAMRTVDEAAFAAPFLRLQAWMAVMALQKGDEQAA